MVITLVNNNHNSNDDNGNNNEPAAQEEQKSQFDLSRRINDHGRRNNKFRDKTSKIINHVCVRVQCICEMILQCWQLDD